MARQIKVCEYKNAGAFEKDAKKRFKDGWEILNQSQGSNHLNLWRITPKIGGFSWTKGKITVTWVRER